MKDFIIMAVMTVLFGVWWIFHNLKNRKPAEDGTEKNPGFLTEEQVRYLNQERKIKTEQAEKFV